MKLYSNPLDCYSWYSRVRHAIFSVDIDILFIIGLINTIITALINVFPLKVVAVVTIKLVLTVDVAETGEVPILDKSGYQGYLVHEE